MLKERIESPQSELANLEAIAAHHRADYERERDRADRRVTELLEATPNTTEELAVTLEGSETMAACSAVRLHAPSPMTRRWRPGGLTSPSDGTAFRTIWLRLRVAELRQAALRPYLGRTGSPLFPLPRSNINEC